MAAGEGRSEEPAGLHLYPLIDENLLHLELDDLLETLLTRARTALDAETGAVLLLDPSGRELVAAVASGLGQLEEDVRQRVRIPVGAGLAGRVAAERAPLVLSEVGDKNVVDRALLAAGVRSAVGVPLLARGSLLGVLHVGTLVRRDFSPAEVELLLGVASQAALAAAARLSRAERTAARMLQVSLLPATLPSAAGLELAGRYVPRQQGHVSGDWYDAFGLPNGELAVTIGDAMGHGLHASVVMSRLRSTLRAYAIESTDPADVLTRLDRKLQHFEPNELATVFYGIFDESLETFRFASAGHLMPVQASPGALAKLLDMTPDAPLGTPAPAPRITHHVAFPPESLLLCYTDGLVERRDIPIDKQLHLLCEVISAGPPAASCSAALDALIGPDGPDDDVALLAVRRHDSPQDEACISEEHLGTEVNPEGVAVS